MQTNFTPEQLSDPDLQSANDILRRCVHCGFCNATCPTYQITGDELDSPRGRIYLMKAMLEGDTAVSDKVTHHLDRCLSCLACMTTCPSGVNYMHLIDQVRPRIADHPGRNWLTRMQRKVLGYVLPRAARLRSLFSLMRPVLQLVQLPTRLRPMGELLNTVPANGSEFLAGHHRATTTRRGTVALLAGCVQPVFGAQINHASVRLLNRIGYDVEVLGDTCCGAIAHHLGQASAALGQVRANVTDWTARSQNWQAIIVNASGCGTMLKDYAYLLRTESGMSDGATKLSPLFMDITEFLSLSGNAPPITTPQSGLKVICQIPCSMRHGQRITDAPRQLLAQAGFDVISPPNDGACCGSAGTYNLLQPELAETLGRNKAAELEATGGQIIASGNLGCMMQIGRYSKLPRVHTVQLLDWASGGPAPSRLRM